MKGRVEGEAVNQEPLLSKYETDQLPSSVDESTSRSSSPIPSIMSSNDHNCRVKIDVVKNDDTSSGNPLGRHNGYPKNMITSFDQLSAPSKLLLKQRPVPSSLKTRKRVVFKNGSINVTKENVSKRSRRYLQDAFTTMVDLRWRYNLLVFLSGFIFSWMFFASIWYFVAFAHGDLGEVDVNHQRCVIGVNSFTTAFLFSFESQHTIGFGNRYPHEDCIEGIVAMCLQSIFGVMVECFVVGFVFAKLSRPKKRSQTLVFTRNAVINRRDGKLCLILRVGDVRARSYIIGASVSALFISKKTTKEGDDIPFYHRNLKLRFDDCGPEIFLVWPATIIHEIDETSPFYPMNADRITNAKFEIIVMLRGTVESTGQTIEARTSYLPHEIIWGKKFENLIDYRLDMACYRVDYRKYDTLHDAPIANVSALEDDLLKMRQDAVEADKNDQEARDILSDDRNMNTLTESLSFVR